MLLRRVVKAVGIAGAMSCATCFADNTLAEVTASESAHAASIQPVGQPEAAVAEPVMSAGTDVHPLAPAAQEATAENATDTAPQQAVNTPEATTQAAPASADVAEPARSAGDDIPALAPDMPGTLETPKDPNPSNPSDASSTSNTSDAPGIVEKASAKAADARQDAATTPETPAPETPAPETPAPETPAPETPAQSMAAMPQKSDEPVADAPAAALPQAPETAMQAESGKPAETPAPPESPKTGQDAADEAGLAKVDAPAAAPPKSEAAVQPPDPGPASEKSVEPPPVSSGPLTERDLPRAPENNDRHGPVALSLKSFIQQVIVVNNVIHAKRKDQEMAEADLNKARAIYEPVGKFAATDSRLRERNSAEEQLLRDNLDIYDRHGDEYQAGVTMLTPTGATVETRADLNKTTSNLQPDAARGREYQSLYEIAVTQPLARDAGTDVTSAKIHMAEMDYAAAVHAARGTTISVVSEAISAYIDLSLAQARQVMWKDGVGKAERLLEESRQMYRQGRLSEATLLDVENNLLRYRAGAADARQKHVEAMNAVRSLLLMSLNEERTVLVAAEPLPQVELRKASFDDSMVLAFRNRADYLARKAVIEREGIRIAYAKNQMLPRIDLIASYGINGFDTTAGKALTELGDHSNFPTWKVGVQVAIPLGGNQQAQADLNSAKLGKEKALLDLKATETALASDVENSLHAIRNGYERWQMYRQVLEGEEKQLEMEHQLLKAGRSDMRSLLAREESEIRSRNAVLEQAAAFAKARVSLEVAQGTLLETYASNIAETTQTKGTTND